MKEKSKKQFRELSDQELEKVTGGGSGTFEPQCVNKDQNKPCPVPYPLEKDGRCCELSSLVGLDIVAPLPFL